MNHTPYELFDGRYRPVANSIGFIKGEYSQVIDALYSLYTPCWKPIFRLYNFARHYIVIDERKGELDEAFEALAPFLREKILVVPTCSEWVAVFKNRLDNLQFETSSVAHRLKTIALLLHFWPPQVNTPMVHPGDYASVSAIGIQPDYERPLSLVSSVVRSVRTTRGEEPENEDYLADGAGINPQLRALKATTPFTFLDLISLASSLGIFFNLPHYYSNRHSLISIDNLNNQYKYLITYEHLRYCFGFL